ncbi:hypothetical protein BDV18DRAFT_136940 [Aspergillus unguis]
MSTISLPLHTKLDTMPAMHMPVNRQYGIIKSYNVEKGFGFITSDFGGELIVRRKSITGEPLSLKEGMKVSYEAVAGPRLLMAEEVQPEL